MQITAVTTDTAANMCAVGRALMEEYGPLHGLEWHGCVAHLLELTAGAFFKAPFVKNALHAARKAVGRYTQSTKNAELLST